MSPVASRRRRSSDMLQEDPSAHVRARLRAQIAALEAGGSGFPFAEGKRGDGGARCAGEACRGEAEGAPASDGAPRRPIGAATATNGQVFRRRRESLPRKGCGKGVPQDRTARLRPRTGERCLRRRLVREGFSEEDAAAAVARAVACGLVDDRRYADVLVRSRLAQGKGRRGIAAELAELGIDAEGVAALAEGGQGDGDDAGELARALAVLDRRPPRAKNLRDAAYRRLVQKGMALRSPRPPRADGANGRPAKTGDPASGRLSVSRLRSLCGHPFVPRPVQQKPPFLDARPRPEVVRRGLKHTFRLVFSDYFLSGL